MVGGSSCNVKLSYAATFVETVLIGVLVENWWRKIREGCFLEVSNYVNISCCLVCTSWEQLDGPAGLWTESCSAPLGEDKSSEKRPLLSCTMLRCNKSYKFKFSFGISLTSTYESHTDAHREFGVRGPSRKEGTQIYFSWRCWLISSKIVNKNISDIITEILV